MITYDPRSISTPVYENLSRLKKETRDVAVQKEQKGQAVELYTYLATWGLMRLKAEEKAQKGGKQQVIRYFFQTLEQIESGGSLDLDKLKTKDAGEYLGLTGLALNVAREFAFWAKAVYADVKTEEGL